MKSLDDSDVRTAITERVKMVRPDSRARWGRMSAHGMLCHLSDSFRLALGEREASIRTGIIQRTLMKWFALYAPLAWPHGIQTMPEVDQLHGGTPPAEFSRDRRELLEFLDRFCRPDRSFDGIRHPIFGLMSGPQWRRWAFLHMDHHLRQFGA